MTDDRTPYGLVTLVHLTPTEARREGKLWQKF
jgi:hypothetical protein